MCTAVLTEYLSHQMFSENTQTNEFMITGEEDKHTARPPGGQQLAA